MKTTLPAPGTSIVSLLASVTVEQLAAKLVLRKPTDGETVIGLIHDEGLRLLCLRQLVKSEIQELEAEMTATATAHLERHSTADFDEKECVPHQEALNKKLADLTALNAYHKTLSDLMWASVRLNFGIDDSITIVEGSEGPTLVKMVDDGSDDIGIGIEIIEVGFGAPPGEGGFGELLSSLFRRRRPRKEPAAPAGPAG